MRTGIIILVGFVLWGGCLGVAKLLGGGSAPSFIRATRTFVAVWFMVAVSNMWVGVTQAGYAASEELPIFLLIFGVPATVAVAFAWRVRRRGV
jgi:hypothetical protein